jgi:hypothetical protein
MAFNMDIRGKDFLEAFHAFDPAGGPGTGRGYNSIHKDDFDALHEKWKAFEKSPLYGQYKDKVIADVASVDQSMAHVLQNGWWGENDFFDKYMGPRMQEMRTLTNAPISQLALDPEGGTGKMNVPRFTRMMLEVSKETSDEKEKVSAGEYAQLQQAWNELVDPAKNSWFERRVNWFAREIGAGQGGSVTKELFNCIRNGVDYETFAKKCNGYGSVLDQVMHDPKY